MTRASELYARLLQTYQSHPAPIDVSFRELVGPIPVNDHGHSVAPYPGRLLRQIPRFFLHCEQFARPGDVILDPFCGSGTVLVEARAARVTSWGIDQNPYARLLSRVKTTPLDRCAALEAAHVVLKRAKMLRVGDLPDVVNIDLWYSEPVKTRLGRLRRAIVDGCFKESIQEYLLLCLALTADKCSFRDQRIPVPVRRRDWKNLASTQGPMVVWEIFEATAVSTAHKLSSLVSSKGVSSIVYGDDASRAADIYSQYLASQIRRPSLILTSPPYGAAQKYIRSSSLALGWAGLASAADLAQLERGCVGREHLRKNERNIEFADDLIASELRELASRDHLRASIYAEYFRAMDRVLSSLATLLAPGGRFILIAGSNIVAGKSMLTHRHLRDIALRHGLRIELELRDTIRGRVLLTKRASTSQPLTYETVHVLKKENG